MGLLVVVLCVCSLCLIVVASWLQRDDLAPKHPTAVEAVLVTTSTTNAATVALVGAGDKHDPASTRQRGSVGVGAALWGSCDSCRVLLVVL